MSIVLIVCTPHTHRERGRGVLMIMEAKESHMLPCTKWRCRKIPV